MALASGCDCPKKVKCLHITGDLVSDYKVTVTITLPKIPKGMSKCEREAVERAIEDDVKPHEEEHKTRFQTYNGRTTIPIDVTGCGKKAVRAQIQAIHDEEARQRQADADALSGGIDPWHTVPDFSACKK